MTQALIGPGTPDHFYAVGGTGDEVLHPETGEVLLNPQTGSPIIQEHPRVAAQAYVDAAQAQVSAAESELISAKTVLTEAESELASADDRYQEIVSHLVAQQSPTGEEG